MKNRLVKIICFLLVVEVYFLTSVIALKQGSFDKQQIIFISTVYAAPTSETASSSPTNVSGPAPIKGNPYKNQEKIPGYDQTDSFVTYMEQIIGFAYAVIGILAMFMLMIGAYQYLMAAGNLAKVDSAKQIIASALLGLGLGLISFLILNTINPDLVSLKGINLDGLAVKIEKLGGGGSGSGNTNFPYSPSSGRTTADIDRAVKNASASKNVPEEVIRAVMKSESSGNSQAVSHKGAKGLMQLMPGTAKANGVTDIFNIDQNVAGGANYLRYLSGLFGGWNAATFAAYNAGEGRVTRAMNKYGDNWLNHMPKEARDYVPQVLANVPLEMRSQVKLRTKI